MKLLTSKILIAFVLFTLTTTLTADDCQCPCGCHPQGGDANDPMTWPGAPGPGGLK